MLYISNLAMPVGEGCVMNKLRSQFVTFQSRPTAKSRLFCFPHAGGAPITFFPWSNWFRKDIECICVQYRGRAQRLREAPLTSVQEIVDEILSALDGYSDLPFAFYGHSFGGIVAFELARQLQSSGRPVPIHLYVGAARPPHLESPFPAIHKLANPEFIARVQSRYGGIPTVISEDPEAMEMFLPAMRGDFTAYETYSYQPGSALEIPITAFGGAEDRMVKPECLREWASHTEAGFDLNILPGGHFFPSTCGQEMVRAFEARIVVDRGELSSTFAG
jgi:surfactin synthase thioesterase subunit